ncbi:hypothetical protein ABZV91_15465 [Nocardia sp. NPDC004568]
MQELVPRFDMHDPMGAAVHDSAPGARRRAFHRSVARPGPVAGALG